MNREETLAWIDDILEALDHHEVIEIIKETIAANKVDAVFFETLDAEIERHKTEGKHETAHHLKEIAATTASVRQNRKENL